MIGGCFALLSLALHLPPVAPPPPENPLDPRDDPRAVVFVEDRVGRGEGAPPRENLGRLVLVTDLDRSDPFFAAVEALKKSRRPRAVLDVPAGRFAAAESDLKRLLPEFALVVTRPERIDVNAHFDFLEMASRLDDDPFVDLAFGYVTGATAAEAVAFAERISTMSRKKPDRALPKTVFDFGPAASGESQAGGPASHPIASGFTRRWLYHADPAEMLEREDLLKGHGILHAGGHGMPETIVDGLSGRDIREHRLDLSPALYFSGPCYCGVTTRWFSPGANGVEAKRVDPLDSFGLAAISAGVTALFAGLDPDRGETCAQEIEHLLIEGDALGHAAKESYDGVTVARREPALRLYRYVEGEPAPQKRLVDTMTGGGAGRALFGDPSFVPYAACASPAFPVEVDDDRDALRLTWTAARGPTEYWMASDVYRCGGGWTHRIAFKKEIPLKTARKLRGFEVETLTAAGEPLDGLYPTAMIERFGGKAYLHVYLVFEPRGRDNVYYKRTDFEARFAFPKS